ncbi:GNAT family N-acetyltransferase [Mangrovicoccus algicola]|uniref:L-ornithine N(alpha)-acyltransferase n=1 Tax=Mangrovicoccus algicola TaxID=2771008 RepID=A0A8J7CYZ3_9RHOB|nr:GNAT family N-acyltransferase [Mangrovicoccus algicola]MBE3637153.1 GNAT family N-acetyltransferase [Mangrovicoccus algicola]
MLPPSPGPVPPRAPNFQVRLARSEEEIRAAQRLRYEVFVEELGAGGPMADHQARLERDRFDPVFDHMLVLDLARGGSPAEQVIGVYRLLPGDRIERTGGFYGDGEYDLSVLKASGRRLLELGRSCLHRDYRGGAAMFHLWTGLAAYTLEQGVEILFGTASFHGTDPDRLAAPLSLLHHRHLAPEDLRVRTLPGVYEPMDRMPEAEIDKVAAMREVPALIKAYLRLGGFVGDGAFVDRDFNTTDICLVLDVARMNARQRAIYTKGLGA